MPPASDPNRTVRRIVVALNAAPHSDAALDAAVHLASQLRVPLHGLFVEDERLLQAATLPAVREVHSAVFRPQRFERADVQDYWRRVAEYIGDVLRHTARQARVKANLDVVRGHVTREVLRAATPHDLLVLGKTSTDSSRRRLGKTARRVLAESEASVLILRQVPAASRPVVAYFDGTDASRQAVRLALRAARDAPTQAVRVLLPPGPASETIALREHLRTLAAPSDPWFQTHVLRRGDMQHLAVALKHEGARLVVLPASAAPRGAKALQTFLHTIDRPVLLTRTPPPASPPAPSPAAMPKPSDADATATPRVVHVSLTPHEAAHVTPLELLEDFADAAPQWQFLEEASRHYARAKGVPACVLRHWLPEAGAFVDVAFAASAPDEQPGALDLVLLDAPDAADPLPPDAQQAIVATLLSDLRAYLADRPEQATLRVETR